MRVTRSQVLDTFRKCHEQRISVTKITVIRKALELEVSYLERMLSDKFVVWSSR